MQEKKEKSTLSGCHDGSLCAQNQPEMHAVVATCKDACSLQTVELLCGAQDLNNVTKCLYKLFIVIQ